MNERRIEFRKHLLGLILLSPRNNSANVLSALSEFSKTREFELAFKQWESMSTSKRRIYYPRSWNEIFSELIAKDKQ